MSDDHRSEAPRATWLFAGLAAFVGVVWLVGLSSRPLFNPDEGRYAEIPREMLAHGDWVIPHLNGLAYIEKPPLQYWATALSLRVFGANEFAARLYTALCALGCIAATALTAHRLWGGAAAWRASAVLASLLLFVILGQLLTLDMSLTFYMTAALAGFMGAQGAPDAQPAGETRGARRWMWVAWGAVALGVLTKGPVAAAIPAAALVLYSLYTRDFAPWRRLQAARGLPLFLGVTVPWHWLAARRLADFLDFYFVHEQVARYLTPSADREEAWWFFGAVFVLGTLPWSVAALRVIATGWRREPVDERVGERVGERVDQPLGEQQDARRGAPRSAGFQPRVFLWLWAVFVVFFFSVSDSKLIPYILPAMPAVALLIASLPLDTLRRDVLLTAVLSLGLALGLAAVCIGAPRFLAHSERTGYFLLLAKPLSEVAALIGLSGAFVLSRRRGVTHGAVFLGVGWCLAGILSMRAAAVVAPIYSGVALGRALQSIPRTVPLFSVATYDQTLPFYAERTARLVAYRGELDFGLHHDASAEIAEVQDFIDQWQRARGAYAVMEIRMFDDLKNRGVPMREVARTLPRVLVARP